MFPLDRRRPFWPYGFAQVSTGGPIATVIKYAVAEGGGAVTTGRRAERGALLCADWRSPWPFSVGERRRAANGSAMAGRIGENPPGQRRRRGEERAAAAPLVEEPDERAVQSVEQKLRGRWWVVDVELAVGRSSGDELGQRLAACSSGSVGDPGVIDLLLRAARAFSDGAAAYRAGLTAAGAVFFQLSAIGTARRRSAAHDDGHEKAAAVRHAGRGQAEGLVGVLHGQRHRPGPAASRVR